MNEYDPDSELYFAEERRNRNREALETESQVDDDDDDTVYCDECGKQCKWSGEEGGYVCYWHGLQ